MWSNIICTASGAGRWGMSEAINRLGDAKNFVSLGYTNSALMAIDDAIKILQAAQAQAQSSDGEAVGVVIVEYFNGRPRMQNVEYEHIVGQLPEGRHFVYTRPQPAQQVNQHIPAVWIRSDDLARAMIASEGERAEVAPDKEGDFDVPLYTRTQQAGDVNMTAIHWAINVLTEAKEIFEAQADDIDPSLIDVAHRCFCAIKGLQQSAQINRQDLIDLLVATRTQSEGVTADLIIKMMDAKPAVNQQLLAALQKAESHMHAMMAHIDHKPRRFQEHCWQQVLDIRAAIAAAQEQGGGE
jgi:hypothetical protein